MVRYLRAHGVPDMIDEAAPSVGVGVEEDSVSGLAGEGNSAALRAARLFRYACLNSLAARSAAFLLDISAAESNSATRFTQGITRRLLQLTNEARSQGTTTCSREIPGGE